MMLVAALVLGITACEGSDWDRHALTGPEANRLVASVEIKPSGAVIEPDGIQEFTAEVKSARGQVISRNVTWQSLDESVLRIDASGNVVAMNEGAATLQATHQGVTGQATVDVHGEVVGIRLERNSLAVDEGAATQLKATYLYANGAERHAGPLQWQSEDPTILAVDADGLAYALRGGETKIRIRGRGHEVILDGLVRTGLVDVVEVIAPTTTLRVGDELQFWVEVRDAKGKHLFRPVTWSSTNSSVASVSSTGVVRGLETGAAAIHATADGVQGSVEITVGSSGSQTEARPGAVTNLTVESTQTNSATLRFREVDDGRGEPARYEVRYARAPLGFGWGSAMRVSKGGCKAPVQGSTIGNMRTCTVESLQPDTKYDFQLVAFYGTLNEGATFGPLSNIASGTTQKAPIQVSVLPSGATLNVGEELEVRAAVTDLYGNTLNRTVSWSSTRSSVASVSGSGNTARITALSPGDTDVRASSDGVAGTSKIRVVRPSSGGFRPNEPSGYTRIAEHDFSCLPGNGCGLAGEWTRRTSDESHLTIVNDPSASQSPGAVLRGRFPRGLRAGISPFRFDGWGPRLGAEYSELYMSFWIKIEGNDYENEATGTKLWYIAYGSSGRNNQSTMFLRGIGRSGALMSSIHLHYFIYEMESDGSDKGGGAQPHMQNRSSTSFRVGQWHQIEAWMKINDIGRDNGEVKWWLDGTLLAHHTGKRFRTAQNPRGFYHMQFTPVWGGGIGERTRDDHFRIDHIYLSGR